MGIQAICIVVYYRTILIPNGIEIISANLFDVNSQQGHQKQTTINELGSWFMDRTGEKVKALRAKHKLSTRELAQVLHVSQAQISRIENGLRQPTGDLLIKMADFFNVTLDRLMRDDLELEEESNG